MLKTIKTLGIAATGVAMLATTALSNPYAEYAGTELYVNFPAHPHFDAVMKILPEFTKETGIEVEVEQLPYGKMREKQTLELAQEEGPFDLLAYVVFSKADYVYADQLENLAKYFMNPKLSDPSYDSDDLIDGYVYNIGFAGGKKGYLEGKTGSLYGIPYGSETSIFGYRKDIFEKHGLEVPTNYDQLLDLACKIPELEPGMGGLASRAAAAPHQASHAWLLHLAPMGGRVFDDQWNPTFNDEAGVKAAKALKKIIDCGPEGAASFGFNEAGGSFLSGDTAMFLDTTIFAGRVDNPELSQVVGKVGWAAHPEDVRKGSQTGGFGIGIPANANPENKEAAFLLLQWLTSKNADKLVALEGGNPSRFSTHDDADVNAKFPHMSTFGEALQYADPDWRPIVPAWGKVNVEIGTALSEIIINDADPQAALDGAAERVKAIMEEAGYYTWN